MSTRPVAPDQLSDGWERINPIAIRMAVPGGWIYDITNSGPVFVPKPIANTWREWEASLDGPLCTPARPDDRLDVGEVRDIV
jgi:hypothetical protein